MKKGSKMGKTSKSGQSYSHPKVEDPEEKMNSAAMHKGKNPRKVKK